MRCAENSCRPCGRFRCRNGARSDVGQGGLYPGAICPARIFGRDHRQILGRVNSIDTFAFFANTTNAQLASLIFAAVAHHNRVVVIGDAGSCPTTGNERFMGNVVQIFQEP